MHSVVHLANESRCLQLKKADCLQLPAMQEMSSIQSLRPWHQSDLSSLVSLNGESACIGGGRGKERGSVWICVWMCGVEQFCSPATSFEIVAQPAKMYQTKQDDVSLCHLFCRVWSTCAPACACTLTAQAVAYAPHSTLANDQ